MPLTLHPITPSFVAEVEGLDASRPMCDEDLHALEQAFWQYAVLILPEQHLSGQQHIEFAR